MTNAPDNSYTQPPPQGQPDAAYANPGLQQGQYANDKPTMEQTTYAGPGPQGAAGDYYQPPKEAEQNLSPYPPNHHEMQSHPTEYQTISPVSGH